MEIPNENPEREESLPNSRAVWEKRLLWAAKKHPKGLTWEELLRKSGLDASDRFEATSNQVALKREGLLMTRQGKDGEILYFVPSRESLIEDIKRHSA